MIQVYRMLLLLSFPFALVFGFVFSKKFRLGLKLRAQALKELPRLDSCFWIHASSGEYEYARPVLKALKAKHPNTPTVVTYFSPSYVKTLKADPLIDHVLPLPLDFPGAVRSLIKALNPKTVFIARTDLWPEWLSQLQNKNVRTVLFSFYQNSKQGTLTKAYKGWLLKKLSEVHCVDEKTFQFAKSLRGDDGVFLSGDTRYDQVFARMENPKSLPFTLPSGEVLVLGSTWPEDEKALIPALAKTKDLWTTTFFVPHETEHLKSLEARLIKAGLTFERFSQIQGAAKTQVILVDRFGYLMGLYGYAHLAFVGGSFRKTVHSVMEPLAYGIPVLTGPKIQNNAEAMEFKNFVLPCKDSDELAEKIKALLKKPSPWPEIQTALQNKRGATAKILL